MRGLNGVGHNLSPIGRMKECIRKHPRLTNTLSIGLTLIIRRDGRVPDPPEIPQSMSDAAP